MMRSCCRWFSEKTWKERMRTLWWTLLMFPVINFPLLAGQAYDNLYLLYDYPRILSRSAVPVCFDHGCAQVKQVSLSDEHWRRLGAHFTPAATSPADEREQIRKAIADMERVAGALAGTSGDLAGDLGGFSTLESQMDCVDESSNTTTYLTLFEQAKLLRWHKVEPVTRRGYFIVGGWPHFSALIRDVSTGVQWVVDSWFRDNGVYPDIIELETWKDGWKPEGFVF